ncbi:MAG: PHP domain-containing protein [Dehalococcoidia bacterium]|nr:PHP domain-containing protein [Dehalococcoidia bacterium]
MSSDLHTHSTASDGLLKPAELVHQAAAAGIKYFAITDHDSTDGLAEARQAAEQHPGLTLIPGIELSTDVQEGEAHILGYLLDVENPELQATLASFRDDRLGRALRMIENLRNLGVPVSWERVAEIAGDGAIGRPHIAQALMEAGHVPSIREAFDRYISNDGPAYAGRRKMTPEEAISLIKKYGGVAALAHPKETPQVESLLPGWVEAGLAGMEVYYGLYPDDLRAHLKSLADQHGLLALGGSDYHGPGRAAECPLGGSNTPLEAGESLLALHARVSA